jgi:hypothetical protein
MILADIYRQVRYTNCHHFQGRKAKLSSKQASNAASTVLTLLALCLVYSFALKMEALRFTEMFGKLVSNYEA